MFGWFDTLRVKVKIISVRKDLETEEEDVSVELGLVRNLGFKN